MNAIRAVVVFVVLCSMAGCASVSPVTSPSASESSTTADESSDLHQLLNQVGADGSVSMDTALQAFALAIAPLPGVTPPSGPPAPVYEQLDGTFAIDWLTPYLDDITPDQKAAVMAALTPASDALVIQPTDTPPAAPDASPNGAVPRDALAAGPGFVADTGNDPLYFDLVAWAKPLIAAKLGRGLHLPVKITVNSTQKESKNYLAYTNPELSPGGTQMTGCDIFVNPALAVTRAANTSLIRQAIAHETFHCFQLELEFGTGHLTFYKAKNPRFSWIIEGQAQWAGEDIAGADVDGDAWWSLYLGHPEWPLWKRTYDAQGFYQHLAEEGIDPWTIFDAMLETDSDVDAFKAANGTNDQFLDTWASGFVRNQSLPQAWDAQGPWFTNAHAPVGKLDVTNGSSYTEDADPVTNADFVLQSTADITELTFTGHARMYTDQVDTPEIETVDLCTNTTANACNCPVGEYYNGPPLQASDGIVFLGLTGALDGTYGRIRGLALDDYCKSTPPAGNGGQPAPRGGSDPCAKGCAGSTGDPHLETVDQRFYNFQGAGEYTLLRSVDDSIEMQGREVPFQDPDMLNVSINTALAWKVNGHRVDMYADPGSKTYRLSLDGSPVDQATAGTVDLGNGSALTVMTTGIEVAYGEGTIATAFYHGGGFDEALDLQVAPSPTLKSQAVGMLAQIAPGSDLPSMPDGSVLPHTTDAHTSFTQRYQQLGPAWLVTQQSSLFDYQTGESAASFVKPDFPATDEGMDDDLDGLQLLMGNDAFGQASAQCAAAQGDPNQFLDCVFDIFTTNDPAWGQFYAILAQFFAAGPTVLEQPQTQASPTPAPSFTAGLPTGVFTVASGISLINGATVGPDGRVYVSLSDNVDYSPSLVAVDPSGAQPTITVNPSGTGSLFLLDGSLWMAESDPTGNGNCLLERFDPSTLTSQAKIPAGCDIGGPLAAPVADGVWWVDRSTEDINALGGTLRHVDPATNKADRSVALPFVNGNMTSSSTTVFYGDSNYGDGYYRLVQGASALEPLPVPSNVLSQFAANDGVWYQPEGPVDMLEEADFVTDSATPDQVIPIDGYLIGADDHAVYGTSPGANGEDQLVRYAADGSGSTVIMSGSKVTTAAGSDDLGFFDNTPIVFANGKVAKLWLASNYPDGSTTSVLGEVTNLP